MNEKQKCLTLVGTASIQEYLFRSNRLKENLGGSYLVVKAIEDFADKRGEGLIYCGGGNAAVIFSDAETAKNEVYVWSKKWLQNAPGLRVVVGHAEFEDGDLHKAYQQAMQALFLNENAPPFGAPLGALPVVRTCASTGLAADEENEDPTTKVRTWLSEEANKKQTIAVEANKEFENSYGDALDVLNHSRKIPLDFDDLGQQQGAAQIAVVHIDGNGIGKLFSDRTNEPQNKEDFRDALNGLSVKITKLAKLAFAETLGDLSWLLSRGLKELKKRGIFLRGEYYPVRPIVDGGDDLTFVCQGKLGIPLAIRYLECFEKHSKAIVGQPLTACAGVAIVHQRFPFAHAYQLAEELASSAKRRRKTVDEAASWIDFEVVREGTLGSLEKLRQDLRGSLASNTKEKYSLLCRPYRVGVSSNKVFDWSSFEALWRTLGGTQSKSGWPRSLAKQLLEMSAYDPILPESLFTEAAKRGHKIECSYHREGKSVPELGGTLFPLYDPLDLIDIYADIDWEELSNERKGGR